MAERLVEGTIGLRLAELAAREDPDEYRARLATLTVLDPACGQGALLRAAAKRLGAEAARIGLDEDVVRANLHGVDRDAEAVRVARGRLPRATIRVGEALLGVPWTERYDVVLGNPPYVKLQTLRRHEPAFADALRSSAYASTKTGNVDLYLPFIELGVRLLGDEGLMGYVAPSLWLTNQYGRGLRRWIAERGALCGWVDFGDEQIFAGATTYTALQFFRSVGDGVVALERGDSRGRVQVRGFGEGPWTLLGDDEQERLTRARRRSRPLEEVCERIAVGVQTSADSIYHLQRRGPGRYADRAGREHAIEDGLMRPLISGPDCKRYRLPEPRRWLLLPYEGARLRPRDDLERRFPGGWRYLLGHEATLRARERGRMDRDDRWWGYNYPKNLDRQAAPKLVVAQTAPGMRVFADPDGRFYLNNVRVNAIHARDEGELWFLLGVLNSAPVDRVFRWTARPKRGGWFEANKQFLAPLPVPEASEAERGEIGRLARGLQASVTAGAPDGDADREIDRRVARLLGWQEEGSGPATR